MRLFIATPVNFLLYGAVKSKLAPFLEGKWVEGWNLHLTHKFIGNAKIEDLTFKLDIPDEKIKVFGLGILGGRILHLKAKSPNIAAVNTQVNEKLNTKNEKPFKPHITLCRIKNIKNDKIHTELKNLKIDFEIPFEVWLYKSTLTKKGPVYEKVYKY